MKRLLLKKSRKLILLLLLGFRYIIMEISFISMMAGSSSSSIISSSTSSYIQAASIASSTTKVSIISSESIPASVSGSGSMSNLTFTSSSLSASSNTNSPFVQHMNRLISKSYENENSNHTTITTARSSSNNNSTEHVKNNSKTNNNIYDMNTENNRRMIVSSIINNNYYKESIANIVLKESLINNTVIKHNNRKFQQEYKDNSLKSKRDVFRYNKSTDTSTNRITSYDLNFKKGEYEEQEAVVIEIKHYKDNERKYGNRNGELNKEISYYNGKDKSGNIIVLQSQVNSVIQGDDRHNAANILHDDDENEINDFGNELKDEMNSHNSSINYGVNKENYKDDINTIEFNENIIDNEYTGFATTLGTIDLTVKGVERYNGDESDQYDYRSESEKPISNDRSQSFFHAASNLLDIFVAVNTAWNTLEKLQNRNQSFVNSENIESNNTDYSAERSRRNSFYSEIGQIPRNNDMPIFSSKPIIVPSSMSSSTTTDKSIKLPVVEGRYIKGDPLKGYYDFVITEGSYKFWACFQLATAILIIYSTFAAIYYSKVNPLVGDYDYVDYLGGGRSLSSLSDYYITDDDDTDKEIVDGTTKLSNTDMLRGKTSKTTNANTNLMWSSIVNGDWIPKTQYTIKFILDAIDRIPTSQ